MRTLFLISTSLISALTLEDAAHAIELKNDGAMDGSYALVEGGFATGEVGAARFVPPNPSMQLTGVLVIFADDPLATTEVTKVITLHIWDDSELKDTPGQELFSNNYSLTASDQLQPIDLSGNNIVVSGAFRVGIEFQHSGLPSIARDNDGTIAVENNFIFGCTGGPGCNRIWTRSTNFGLLGDWILRAEVVAGSSGGGTSSSSGTGTGTGGSGTGGSGTGGGAGAGGPGECQGNQDCPIGQYCNDAGACTMDCRVSSDCPAGTMCNSLGQCIPGSSTATLSGAEGGCSTAPGDRAAVAGLLGGLAALAAAFRRRRS